MTARDIIALDKGSVRSFDSDQRLRVASCRLTRAEVSEYLGREVPQCEEFGLEPDKLYPVLRPADELQRALASFNSIPVLSQHTPVSADDPQKQLVCGATGTDAAFDGEWLTNSFVVWDADVISDISDGVASAVSCGYRYTAIRESGEFNGVPYMLRMTDIEANHMAIVGTPRVKGAVIGDSALPPPEQELRAMAQKKGILSPRLATAFEKAGALRERIAQDADLTDLVTLLDVLGEGNEPDGDEPVAFPESNPDVPAPPESPVAPPNADVDPAAPAEGGDPIARILESLKGVLTDEDLAALTAAVAPPAAAVDGDLPAFLEKKDDEKDEPKAQDEDDDTEKKDEPEVTKQAMDAALLAVKRETEAAVIARMRATREAEKAVRPTVGEIAIACDSADEVYRAAFGMMNVPVKGLPAAAYPVLFAEVAKARASVQKPRTNRVAMDAAQTDDYNKRFPHAARVRHA